MIVSLMINEYDEFITSAMNTPISISLLTNSIIIILIFSILWSIAIIIIIIYIIDYNNLFDYYFIKTKTKISSIEIISNNKHENKSEEKENNNNEGKDSEEEKNDIENNNNNNNKIKIEEKNEKSKQLQNYIESLFPSIFAADTISFSNRILIEIKKHHIYFNAIFPAKENKNKIHRILSVIQLITFITLLLFIIAIFYDIEVSKTYILLFILYFNK